MFQLTNEQRRHMGLLPLLEEWQAMRPKPSPHDQFETVCYGSGNRIHKVTLAGPKVFGEYEVSETLSDDGTMLLPKTPRGKPVLFSTANLLKRTGTGMHLAYSGGYISLYSEVSYRNFFCSESTLGETDFDGFVQWVADWCASAGEADDAEIWAFTQEPRRHCKYREGDFFRIRYDRHLYGYGRILVDYDAMRKAKIPFWDILMGKPLLVAVYHVLTERTDLTPEDLRDLEVLPPVLMMDNRFFYGEYPIIGNEPVELSNFDCPVHYGRETYYGGRETVKYQCGKTYCEMEGVELLEPHQRNNGIGWTPQVSVPVLRECIGACSNAPYWAWDRYRVQHELRNPKYREKLAQIRAQVEACLESHGG